MRLFHRILLLALAAYVVGFLLFVMRVQQPAPVPHRADGIVALTGGEARVDAAVDLLEKGKARRLLITGVHPATTKEEIRQLTHGGARFECCTDLGFTAADTHGNARETAQWTRAHGYKTLIIVTANYHMPRSLTEFSAVMGDVTLEPYPVQPEEIDLRAWWRSPRTLGVLSWEYAKYLASLVMTHLPGNVFERDDAGAATKPRS